MKRIKKSSKPKRQKLSNGRRLLIKSVLKFMPWLEDKTPSMTNDELLDKCHPFLKGKVLKLLENEKVQ